MLAVKENVGKSQAWMVGVETPSSLPVRFIDSPLT
jgi:hypothetical protein